MTVQFIYLLWEESPAQLHAAKAVLPLKLPGERQLHNVKAANKCEDGMDIKTFQLFAAAKTWDEIRHGIFTVMK